MKKILRFEVEEGDTPSCEKCELSAYDGEECIYNCCFLARREEKLNCAKYDMSTIKFIGEESNESKN